MYQDSYREDNVYHIYNKLYPENCLLAGLGELELISKWFKGNRPTCELEVVEIDTRKKTSLTYPVHYGDIFKFTPTVKYNLIILDIWYDYTENYKKEIEFLKTKYFYYLKEGGHISLPMIDMHTVYSYVELQRRNNWLKRANA